jgi:hypothetical protein
MRMMTCRMSMWGWLVRVGLRPFIYSATDFGKASSEIDMQLCIKTDNHPRRASSLVGDDKSEAVITGIPLVKKLQWKFLQAGEKWHQYENNILL